MTVDYLVQIYVVQHSRYNRYCTVAVLLQKIVYQFFSFHPPYTGRCHHHLTVGKAEAFPGFTYLVGCHHVIPHKLN
jgi:hypothetical protein